jgi:hypothetical protein
MNRKRKRVQRRSNPDTSPDISPGTMPCLSFSPMGAGGGSFLVRLTDGFLSCDQAKAARSNKTAAMPQPASKDDVAGWLIFTAIHNPEFTKIARTLVPTGDIQETFTFLSKAGCDQALLTDCLVLAYRLTDWVLSPSATDLRNLARDLEDVLNRMRFTVPSHVFLMATPDGKDPNRGVLKEEGTAGYLHVWPSQLDDLKKKVVGYRELAKLCTERFVPRMDRLKRDARLLPVAYVKRATGQPYYERVSKLLEWAGGQLDKSKDDTHIDYSKLGAYYRAAENTAVMSWLEHIIWLLEQTVMSRAPNRP